MSFNIEFESKEEADRIRDRYDKYICSDDDARLTTVTLVDDAPSGLRDGIPVDYPLVEFTSWEASTLRTAAHRSEHDDVAEKINTLDLTEGETVTVEFTPLELDHAVDALVGLMEATPPSMESIMGDNDETLRHINGALDALDAAGVDGIPPRSERVLPGDDRNHSRESVHDRACRHARGHCKHGDPDACEFLQEECDLDESEVATLFEEPDDRDDSGDLDGPALGALKRSWQGYKGAISALDELLDDVRDEWEEAQQAARAINSVRDGHGQEPLHFEELEERQGRLTDLVRKASADCHECHSTHSAHTHEIDTGAREELGEFLRGDAADTPVGVGEDNDE